MHLVPALNIGFSKVLHNFTKTHSKEYALRVASLLGIDDFRTYLYQAEIEMHGERSFLKISKGIGLLKLAYKLEKLSFPFGSSVILKKIVLTYMQSGMVNPYDLGVLDEALDFIGHLDDPVSINRNTAKMLGAFLFFDKFEEFLKKISPQDQELLIKDFLGSINSVSWEHKTANTDACVVDLLGRIQHPGEFIKQHGSLFSRQKILSEGDMQNEALLNEAFMELQNANTMDHAIYQCKRLILLGVSIQTTIYKSVKKSKNLSEKDKTAVLIYLKNRLGYPYYAKKLYKKMIDLDPENKETHVSIYNGILFLEGLKCLKKDSFSIKNACMIMKELYPGLEKDLLGIFIDYTRAPNKQSAQRELVHAISTIKEAPNYIQISAMMPILQEILPVDHPIIQVLSRDIERQVGDTSKRVEKIRERGAEKPTDGVISMRPIWNGTHIRPVDRSAIDALKPGWKE